MKTSATQDARVPYPVYVSFAQGPPAPDGVSPLVELIAHGDGGRLVQKQCVTGVTGVAILIKLLILLNK